MGKCINHPEIETSYLCMKHNIYLCEACLECRDPDIYCKFRSSCPIYFISEKGFDKKPKEPVLEKVTIVFQPGNHKVAVQKGANILESAQQADIYINASCNGNGSCGKCKLIVESGTVESKDNNLISLKEKEKGVILACQATVTDDVILRIPEETLEKKLKAAGMGNEATGKLANLVKDIDPMLKKYTLSLKPPDLDDTISDLSRLKRGLEQNGCDTFSMHTGIKVMRQLTHSVREDNWNVSASVLQKKCSSEIVDVRSATKAEKTLGLAVDLGTTSIVVYIVDMETGKVLSAASGHNGQAACGDDVINRIVCSENKGVKKLKKMALSTINNLIQRALDPLDENHKHIESVVVSGNTTMVHLLLGIEARYIRREPYIPTISEFPIIKAGHIGMKTAHHAGLFVMPGPASYVGGDIVSGVLYTGMHRTNQLTLFIDVGTNGEIVLGNNDFLLTAACSAGPAFEGGGIQWGMRAETGAIEKITIDPKTFKPDYITVENKSARGICGSGMIDLMSEMIIKGVIGQDGKYILDMDHPRMKMVNNEPAFILEFAENTDLEENIIFTESDIKSLTLSKAAVYAGFTVLLEQIGMDFSMVQQMIITGGFGEHLDIDKAVIIGLLPDIERKKFKYMGNSSIAGAYMALLSGKYRTEALDISNTMTYVDFSSNSRFMDEFTRAQFLPHTDADLFPSVNLFLKN